MTAHDDRPVAGIPLLPRSYIPRVRLWDRLNVATEGSVTMVIAPAGAGKTLGVAGWLRRTGRAADAWWVGSTSDLSVEDLRTLTEIPSYGARPTLLILDDAHTLSRQVLRYLDDRLSQDPQTLRVVLLSRWDLALTRQVPELLGDLTVLRGDLLRLDEREVASLVAAHARTDSTEVYTAIYEQSRGWCAAVVLAARAVAASSDPAAAARNLLSGTSLVDRLTTEAFASLTVRQRHVLLCVADEPLISPSLASHLSRDAEAGRLLEELESTGLLVSRYAGDSGPLENREKDQTREETGYRLHPLLVEMARRRLAAGGVDVEQARATVQRAVALDLRQGELRRALRRLVAMGSIDAAIRLLADQGVLLVLAGEADEIVHLVRDHAQVVEAEAGCWLPVALHHWLAGDVAASRNWLQRLDLPPRSDRGAQGVAEGAASWPLEQLCARLMRARLGDGSLSEAVADGEAVLNDLERNAVTATPLLSLALLHLGIAELQIGRLSEADRMLTRVVLHGRSSRLPALSAGATAALALSQLLQGREHATLELATEMPYKDANLERAGTILVRDFALLQSRLHIGESALPVLAPRPRLATMHPADRVGAALSRVYVARLLLLRGLVTDAERTLDSESLRIDLPAAVHVLVLVEQALYAAVALDRDRLTGLGQELDRAGCPGEAAFVRALCADVVGDIRGAIELCGHAVDLSTCVQPPVAAMARVVRSQLLDVEGQRSEAQDDFVRALSATVIRRNALPFLGWSRHGSSIVSLLHGLPESSASEWTEELLVGLAEHPGGIFSVAGPMTATPQERAHLRDRMMSPDLSPRERDVLHELARGATYADIASNLYLSENTVKTHVSSLYAKLAVGRRSDALAVARTMHLL
ncbi:MAG: LuxR C-terminal-related transcriptional regulator [Nocardioidaceae bacterium]